MRGALFIGVIVVLLIIGILVMKNMGVDNPSDAQETQSKAYIERAKSTADDVEQKFKDIGKHAQSTD